MQQTFISGLHGVLNRAVFDDAFVDEKNLMVAIGARQLRARGKTRDPNVGGFQV